LSSEDKSKIIVFKITVKTGKITRHTMLFDNQLSLLKKAIVHADGRQG
jgi:hypothetical protein